MGNNIKNFRKREGLTQKQLSQIVGVSPNYISKIENGKVFFQFHCFVGYVFSLKYNHESFLKIKSGVLTPLLLILRFFFLLAD